MPVVKVAIANANVVLATGVHKAHNNYETQFGLIQTSFSVS